MYTVSEIYDTLLNVESTGNKVVASYPIHKRLIFNKKKLTIPEIILERAWIAQNSHIYDAGCGTGFSLFYFKKMLKCTGVGVSLSEQEITYAKQVLKNLEEFKGIDFEVRDFNEARIEKFDVILLIESVKHSTNLNGTIQMLENSLKPGGMIILAEDIAEDEIVENPTIAYYKNSWGLSTIYSSEDYKKAFKNFATIDEVDLTKYMVAKSKFILNIGISLFKFLGKLPFFGRYYSIFGGGMVQELLYASGKVKYKLICFKK